MCTWHNNIIWLVSFLSITPFPLLLPPPVPFLCSTGLPWNVLRYLLVFFSFLLFNFHIWEKTYCRNVLRNDTAYVHIIYNVYSVVEYTRHVLYSITMFKLGIVPETLVLMKCHLLEIHSPFLTILKSKSCLKPDSS